MTPEQQKAVDQTAQERAAFIVPTQKQVTLDELHKRVTALENHPALKAAEESNG